MQPSNYYTEFKAVLIQRPAVTYTEIYKTSISNNKIETGEKKKKKD